MTGAFDHGIERAETVVHLRNATGEILRSAQEGNPQNDRKVKRPRWFGLRKPKSR